MVITCYNETDVDVRALNLTNQVGTINIVPVNFSYPSGSFRVESKLVFTHFVASITAADGDRVFKITGFTAINSQVIEYYYELDYLKDYWYRNHSGSQITIEHAFVKSEYDPIVTILAPSPYALDTKVTGVVDNYEEKTGGIVNFCTPMFVMLASIKADPNDASKPIPDNDRIALKSHTNPDKVLSPESIYFISDAANVFELYQWALKRETWDTQIFSSFYSNILRGFYAPFYLPPSNIPSEIVNYLNADETIYYFKCDGTITNKAIQGPLGVAEAMGYITLPTTNGIVEQIQNTGVTVNIKNANDLPPYKKYEVFVPYIGWYTLPIQDLFPNNLFGEQQIAVKYFMDLMNGQIACEFGLKIGSSGIPEDDYVWSSFKTPYVALPKLLIPTTDYAFAQLANENNFRDKTLSNFLGTGAGVVGGLVTGHPLVAAAAVGAGVISQITANNQYEQTSELNQASGFTTGIDSNIGKLDREFKLKITEYHCALSYTDAGKLFGYPVYRYQNTIDYSITGRKYWLDLSTANIKGTQEYAEGVRAAYNYDYTTVSVA